MNATTLEELRKSAAGRDSNDETMDKVRQLLFGDHTREANTRFMLLESRLRELEADINGKLDAISARLDALASDADSNQKAAFGELSRSIHDLGERIGTMAKR